MKPGIDSYTFHRYFGEIRMGVEDDPGIRWTTFDLLAFAAEQGASGLSLETCYMPALDMGFLGEVRNHLDQHRLDCVLAWGHPRGLEGGASTEALKDLIAHIPSARALGTKTMRITASGGPYSQEREEEIVRDVVPALREAVRVAEDQDVVLALENHGDLSSGAILHLLDAVGSEHLRVTLDTGNAHRIENAVEAARKLAPFVAATHIKDLVENAERPGTMSTVPIGKGVVPIPEILRLLHDAAYNGLLCIEIEAPAPAWRGRSEEDLVSMSLEYLASEVNRITLTSR